VRPIIFNSSARHCSAAPASERAVEIYLYALHTKVLHGECDPFPWERRAPIARSRKVELLNAQYVSDALAKEQRDFKKRNHSLQILVIIEK
jgi:hypothetical protein